MDREGRLWNRGETMRYSRAIAAILLAACMVCASTAAYAVTSPPSTDGWFLGQAVDGDNINLFFSIDNMAELQQWNGFVTRVWGDPTGTDPSQFINLGNGVILQSMTVSVDADPRVSVEFHFTAGETGANITVTSDIVSFAMLPNCLGAATAALTLTDLDGDGAMATGGYDNGCFFRAICNDTDTFCYLVDNPISAEAYSSNTALQTLPPWVDMNGIYNISAEFKFHLSPNDAASGTSNFVVMPVPEPGAIVSLFTGIVGLAGFAARRRRA